MAKIVADGDKLISCGEDIMSLAKQYNDLIDELFIKLSKIKETAWSGTSANLYTTQIMANKTEFKLIGSSINTYGKVIKNTGISINNVIRKWNDK